MTLTAVLESSEIALRTARYLLIAMLIAALLSTSVTVGFEIACYVVFVIFAPLRQRVLLILRQPVALALVLFLAAVAVATLYGLAPFQLRLGGLNGWRKALLFFFALAVFDDEKSKNELIGFYFGACLVLVVVSYVMYVFSLQLSHRVSTGIIILNYATQSFVLSIATGVAVLSLIDRARFAADPLLRYWPVALVGIVLFVLNIAFVSQGRSAYFMLITIVVTLAVTLMGQSTRTKLVAGAAVLALVVAVLATSSQVRHRIVQAIDEMQRAEQAETATSGAVRVVVWKRAVEIIADHPVLGVGTNGYGAAYAERAKDKTGWQSHPANDPHNQYLKIWTEQGLIGLLPFLAFIVLAFMTPATTPYRELGLAILLGVCITSLFNSHFSTFHEGRILYLWLGAMLAGPALLVRR